MILTYTWLGFCQIGIYGRRQSNDSTIIVWPKILWRSVTIYWYHQAQDIRSHFVGHHRYARTNLESYMLVLGEVDRWSIKTHRMGPTHFHWFLLVPCLRERCQQKQDQAMMGAFLSLKGKTRSSSNYLDQLSVNLFTRKIAAYVHDWTNHFLSQCQNQLEDLPRRRTW